MVTVQFGHGCAIFILKNSFIPLTKSKLLGILHSIDAFYGAKNNTLEAHRDSYAVAVVNHPSTKSKVPKIGNNSKPISSVLIKSSPQGNSQIIPLLLY